MTPRETAPRDAGAARTGPVYFLLVLLFVLAVAYLQGFRPEAAGFEQKGPLLLLYHLSRLIISLGVAVTCYCAGFLTLGLWGIDPRGLFGTSRSAFILCFFLGASLYGILFTLLGLAGMIGLPAGVALTVPVLLLSRRPLKSLLEGWKAAIVRQVERDEDFSPGFILFVALIVAWAVGMFLATRTLFVAVFDPNIWEHYLHYYRAVLAGGSTQPNEVWHHFYASKGAGLIFLANELSDFFGVQLVSACFVLVAGLIIFDLLLEYCRSTGWALFGVLLFLVFLYGQVSDGATFKHHAVILGYMSLALWGSIRIARASEIQYATLLSVMAVSLAYFGFYQPAMLVLLAPVFVLLVATNAVAGEKMRIRTYACLAAAMVAGGALAFWTNWTLTGVPEITPMRTVWEFADRTKFKAVFGTGGVEYFLGMNNNLATHYDWSLNRVWRVLQYPLPVKMFFLSLLGTLVVLAWKPARDKAVPTARILLPLAAFVLPLGLFAQAMQTAAVDRVALYSIVMTSIAGVVMLKIVCDALFSSGAWMKIPVRVTVSGRRLFVTRNAAAVFRAAAMAVILLGMFVALTSAWKAIGHKKIVYGYVSGAISLKDSMQAMESVSSKATTGLANGIGVSEMMKFRQSIGSAARIVRLTYDSGFSYSLPGEGIVSEPTYALIRDRQGILAAAPGAVAAYLRDGKIDYFIVNLQGNLFSSIAFTSLFDVHEMPKYFRVAYEDSDIFILGWRRSADDKPLPPYLLTLFELKQSGMLNFPFGEGLEKLLLPKERSELIASVGDYRKVRREFQERLARVFESEVMHRVKLETSRAALLRMLDASQKALAQDEPGDIESGESLPALKALLSPEQGNADARIEATIWKHDLERRFLVRFREAMLKAQESEVGKGIATLSLGCDERVPFAGKYPPGASC
jgi:hypothetical protein